MNVGTMIINNKDRFEIEIEWKEGVNNEQIDKDFFSVQNETNSHQCKYTIQNEKTKTKILFDGKDFPPRKNYSLKFNIFKKKIIFQENEINFFWDFSFSTIADGSPWSKNIHLCYCEKTKSCVETIWKIHFVSKKTSFFGSIPKPVLSLICSFFTRK